MTSPSRGRVRVMAGAALRLRRGHLWVFRNEVLETEGASPGGEVRVEDPRGRPLGSAFWNPKSVLALRVADREGRPLDGAFLKERIAGALERRRRLGYGDRGAFRVVSSEGDLLPGLVVDRYGGAVVFQIGILALERMRSGIVDALRELLSPEVIVERSDGEGRRREGLPPRSGVVEGRLDGFWPFELDGLRFRADLLAGHKTGFYLDQAPARRIVRALARGRRVVDAFAYTGAFACAASAGGAVNVVAIESARRLAPEIEAHARLNGFEGRIEIRTGEVLETLKRLRGSGDRFGMVILDPPPSPGIVGPSRGPSSATATSIASPSTSWSRGGSWSPPPAPRR